MPTSGRPRSPGSTAMIRSLAYASASLVLIAELISFVSVQGRAGGLASRLADALAFVEQSRYAEAVALLATLATESQWIPNLRAMIVHRRAEMFFVEGDLDQA